MQVEGVDRRGNVFGFPFRKMNESLHKRRHHKLYFPCIKINALSIYITTMHTYY